MATRPLPSKLGDTYQTYPTASAAAVAALRGITNKNTETGGGILYNKEQNTYAATQPVGQSDETHFAAAVSVPQGWQLQSTYHTHPSGPQSTMFSDCDISTAQQLKAPSYILARDDNKIRVFDPASSKVMQDRSAGMLSNNKYSNGSLVNESPPQTPQTTLAASAPPTPPTPPTPPATPTAPSSTQAPPVAGTLASNTVPVTGSRVTMKDFAARHRVQKYRHKIVRIESRAK